MWVQVFPASVEREIPSPPGNVCRGGRAWGGIVGVEAVLSDLTRFGKTDVGPSLSRVRGAVDSISRGNVSARAGGAGPDVDHVRVRGRHRDGADGGALPFPLGEIPPGLAGVV